MKYQIIQPDEKIEVTREFINKNLNTLTPQFRRSKRDMNTTDCNIYRRGKIWIIEHDGVILYHESHNDNYPFFEMAFHYMDPAKARKWKTVSELATFRQAIREATVQGTDYVETILEEPLTERTYRKFMRFARAHDFVHHGGHTF